MTDQSTQLQQLLSNSAIQEAVQSIGPMPYFGSGSTSGTSLLDPNSIASEIFGFRIDLGNRASLLDALKRALPMQTDPESGKLVVGYRPVSESITTQNAALPLVGPLATAAAALQALSNHAAGLDEIRPLIPRAGDTGDHLPLIILVRSTIQDLVQQFATGRPLVQQVDVLLATLYTETCSGAKEPPVGKALGYLGELGERCGIVLENVSSLEDEKTYTNYTALVALTRMFADVWKDARVYNEGDFLTISIQDLHRHLFAIVGGLGRLRELIPAAAWATTEIDDPPIVAAEFWNWMHQYCGTTALVMMQQGRDGIFGVNKTMQRFSAVLSNLLVDEDEDDGDGNGGDGSGGDGAVNYCQGVPNAFDDEEVQDVIREMLCQLQRIVQATTCVDPPGLGRRRRAVRHVIAEPVTAKPTTKPTSKPAEK